MNLLLCIALLGAPENKSPEATIASVKPNEIAVGRLLSITVKNPPANWDPDKMILYLDGIPLVGHKPVNRDFAVTGRLRFRLKRTKAAQAAWQELMTDNYASRKVDVALGTEEKAGGSCSCPNPGLARKNPTHSSFVVGCC
jgi:hypothetical protein